MPVDRDFYTFLTELLGPGQSDAWRGAVINRVEVYPLQQKWRILLTLFQPVPAEVIEATSCSLEGILDSLEQVELVTMIPDHEMVAGILSQHWETITTELCASQEGVLTWSAQGNKLDLVAEDESLYNHLMEAGMCTQVTRWFWEHYRLQIIPRLHCEISARSDAIEETTFIPAAEYPVLEYEPNASNGRNGRRSAKKRKGKTDQPTIKISELQEGQVAVTVAGEVWQRELQPIKGGRYAAGYYITDYTGTVILKHFVDAVDSNGVKVGDWIVATGDIRHDEYSKEAALFMDSYAIGEVPRRMDEAPEKRIELHAHTKMSAMDGLTEVEKLVATAARWNHAAVAITDHGCVQAFPDAYHAAEKYGIKVIYGVEGYLIEKDRKDRSYHVILLARNEAGLRNLYTLISLSYLDHFYFKPRIPREALMMHREGILVGSACQAGELFQAMLNRQPEEQIMAKAGFYDYLEIQPLPNNEFLVRDGMLPNLEALQELNRKMIAIGKESGKPVVATGDVHFLDPHHGIYRTIIQAGQGYQDAESDSALYFRTTEEMLAEFAYLDEATARSVVIEAPALINQMIDEIKPVPDGFYPPEIESADEDITRLAWERAYEIYGQTLPATVQERVERELRSITGHGFSVLYLIAHKLVRKSNQDGYMVGSRGSVGSSLVAYLTGITEVNPMAPHYLCRNCGTNEFVTDGRAGCGADLPEKACLQCGQPMFRDGFDIPFETFLGFEGDKVPDIDLNFSGEYQARAHQYVEELFGSENVFRAGTVSTIADKTAYGFVKKYFENRDQAVKNSEVLRLVQGITGVRKTTGQHPGGLIVVPKDHNILEFTPLQHPADKKDSGIITTHFEYHAIGDQLVKLDILGHDDPTAIKELEELTGVPATSIQLGEKETMRIFSSLEPLGLDPKKIRSSVGTIGVPEFGTRFVRQILETTRPTTMTELVRICGLSHGTDVWVNNAQELIDSGTAQLTDVICTRDDIMLYLIQQGMEHKVSFKIMENVRKGKGLKPDEEALMKETAIPTWYIQSCQKIKYMFPKAHAVAYVTMAFRIAYYKVHYPLAFYATFFSVRAEDFDAESALQGYEAIRKKMQDIEKQGNKASQKDKKLLVVLEVALEMCARGYSFLPVDLYQSHASKFRMHGTGLLIPFSSLPNVGLAAAQGIVSARGETPFISVEDFQMRTHLNKTGMEMLRKYACFDGLPESSQISLFG